MTILGKECSRCHVFRPLDQFDRNKKMKLGRLSFCKACVAERYKVYRASVRAKNLALSPHDDPARTNETKRCSGCKTVKPIREFYRLSDTQNGCSTYCRICTLIRVARTRARDAGVPFDLSPEDISVPPTCPALGIPLSYGKSGRHEDGSASIDRIRPGLGYVRGNVVVVSWLYNRLKSNVSDPEIFQKIADFMRKHRG